jgi:UDP-2,3-diacylglucosamine pyrophosphatase LpxH
MLVTFSDIHLTDETTAVNVNSEAFTKILQKEIESSARNNQAKEIRIVLNGDIFDFVRTDYWLKTDKSERPWNGTLDLKTAMNNDSAKMDFHYCNILDLIMKTKSGKGFCAMLNSLSKKFKNDTPVRITYITGNHDRILNTSINLRNKIKEYLGEYTDSSIDFANEYLNAEDYSVLCRHGHEWDDTNFGIELYKYINNSGDYLSRFQRDIYNLQTIGEVITCELMSGIIYRVKQQSSDSAFVDSLKDLNNVRPLSDAFLWLYWYGVAISTQNKKILLSAFRDSMTELVNTGLSKLWDNIKAEVWLFSGDITDRFEQMLDLIQDLDFDSINKYVEVFKIFDNIFGTSKDDFVEGAMKEFKNRYYIEKDIQYILYGHTHEERHDYFYGNKEGKVKMYINTGTFLPYIQKTNDKKSFASAYQMTMVFIYRRDEDTEDGVPNKFPTMELWNGIKRKKYPAS